MNIVKNFVASAPVTAYSIVMFGNTDGNVLLAAAETDGLVGVTGIVPAAVGGRVDVTLFGIAEVQLAGSVTRGRRVTANAAGLGVELNNTMLAAGHASSVGIALESGTPGAIISVMVLPQWVSRADLITSSVAELDALNGAAMGCTFTIGAENSNAINVALQLTDANDDDVAERQCVYAYLSNDQYGDSLATAPAGGVAIGTDGLAAEVIDNRAFFLTSEADGDIDLNITVPSGSATYYLAVRLANGKLVVSEAITFAA